MNIAIQGHPTRGKEVIRILESLGGNNLYTMTGSAPDCAYYINSCYNIDGNSLEFAKQIYQIYTLKEFEKEFPFKVGDKVFTTINKRGTHTFKGYVRNIDFDKHVYICSFEDSENASLGGLDSRVYCKPEELFIMKEERNITLTLDKAKEWYKKGGDLKQVALQAYSEEELTKKEFPKTWDEFCENYPVRKGECWLGGQDNILNCAFPDDDGIYRKHKNWIPSEKSAEAHLAMIQLEQLRNCWWDGWEPIWDISEKWCIRLWRNELSIGITTSISKFLTFPTKEMAIEFFKCFSDLIEKAGDLI